MRQTTWLFILALCLISCGSSPFSRNTTSPTPIPEKPETGIAFEQNTTPAAADFQEPAVVPTSTPQTPAGPDINAIITNALSVMANVGTFHFIMDRQLSREQEAEELTVHIPVQGKFNAPDSIQGTILVSSNEQSVALDFIVIGEDIYLREENSELWQHLDWQSNAAQAVRENAYLPLQQLSSDNFHNPVLVGEARLGGLPVYHVHSEFVNQGAGETNPGGKSVDFWIGKEDYLIYRVISETIPGDGEEVALVNRSKIQVDYASFGGPVLIVAPQVDTSGGFRPTGSYPTLEQMGESLDGGGPLPPADQTGSAADSERNVENREASLSTHGERLD